MENGNEKLNFDVMMATASEKYTKLISDAYKLKNGSEVDFDKFIKLIGSVYKDEVNLIFKLGCYKHENEHKEVFDIDLPNF